MALVTQKVRFVKAAIVSAVFVGFLAVPGLRSVRADHDCQRVTAKYDRNLHEAIEKHGVNSKQAEHWRNELHEERERCWKSNHRWWDEDNHSWHNDRDWDDHDHDRH